MTICKAKGRFLIGRKLALPLALRFAAYIRCPCSHLSPPPPARLGNPLHSNSFFPQAIRSLVEECEYKIPSTGLPVFSSAVKPSPALSCLVLASAQAEESIRYPIFSLFDPDMGALLPPPFFLPTKNSFCASSFQRRSVVFDLTSFPVSLHFLPNGE